MGAPQEILEEIFTVIEGGSTIGSSADIIQFPKDNGSGTFDVVQKTIRSANGGGLNYWVSAVVSGASAVSAGALFISCTFPEFVALAVPCLGIAVGTIWYNMAPEFWDNIAEKLVNSGYTFKGKVVGYMNTEGNLTFPEGAIKILADDLIDAGIFIDNGTVLPEEEQTALFYPEQYSNVNLKTGVTTNISFMGGSQYDPQQFQAWFHDYTGARTCRSGMLIVNNGGITPIVTSEGPFTIQYTWNNGYYNQTVTLTGQETTRNDITYYVAYTNFTNGYFSSISMPSSASFEGSWDNRNNPWDVAYIMDYGTEDIPHKELLQEGAVYPQKNVNWRDLFPEWIPWEFPLIPISGGEPFRLPPGLPVEYPNLIPVEQPYQQPAQNPDENAEENPDTVIETIQDPAHDPRTEYQPGASTETDPDAGAEDENIPGTNPNGNEDPVDPDPPIPPSPIIPIPLPPASVSSNKLFTVYNPTSSQLDQLGGYLWDGSLIETLKKIWQDPMDGIIGLSQVYCTPSTGGSHNIILGYLDSGVSSAVVTNQFSHIDCGEIDIPELNENATDYNPYTAIQIYLPFIGITELDINEFMSGKISVKYHIDVYTGTCLAEVKMTRTRDVPNGGIVYTFTGNCSQQLPLTSGDQKGLLSALIGAAGVGLGIASGGMTAAASAGMALGEVRRDVSREMMHVSHSGNLSANAGIMGQKKPYVIISRQKPYNASNYGKFYGYPVNKTVFLSNFNGFCRVKSGRLRSKATEEEKREIMELCREGIIM